MKIAGIQNKVNDLLRRNSVLIELLLFVGFIKEKAAIAGIIIIGDIDYFTVMG